MGFCYLPPERVKMGCCCLHPDRVKLTVNSKKETSSRVKMGQGSRWAFVIYPLKEPNWAKGQDGLLLFTPGRVELTVNSKEKQTTGSKWAMDQGFFGWNRLLTNWVKRNQLGPGPFWLWVKLGRGVKMGRNIPMHELHLRWQKTASWFD